MSGWSAIAKLANTISGGLLDKEMRRRDDETWSRRSAEQERAIQLREEADARRAERLAQIKAEGDQVQSWLQARDEKKAREAQAEIERMKEEGRLQRENMKQDRADARAKMPRQAPASRSDMWRNSKTGEVKYFGPSNPPPSVDWQPYNGPSGNRTKAAGEFDMNAYLDEVEGL